MRSDSVVHERVEEELDGEARGRRNGRMGVVAFGATSTAAFLYYVAVVTSPGTVAVGPWFLNHFVLRALAGRKGRKVRDDEDGAAPLPPGPNERSTGPWFRVRRTAGRRTCSRGAAWLIFPARVTLGRT